MAGRHGLSACEIEKSDKRLAKSIHKLDKLLITDKRARLTYPTWNNTLGPMQKKQSMMRNANTIGMLLMNLKRKAPFVSTRLLRAT